jgi:uncharacterized protein with von Willebrand factor type A (vWA) domain
LSSAYCENKAARVVLAFFDVGGSRDFHIRECEELRSAARSEFEHMDYSEVLAVDLG